MRRLLVLLVLVAAVASVAVLSYGGIEPAYEALRAQGWFQPANQELVASGTLEARDISVGSKVGGRVVKVLVREGDHVQAGQLLVVFDDAELKARLTQAQGDLEAAQADLARLEHGTRPEDIAEAEAAAAARQGEDRRHGFRVEEVSQARADLQRIRVDAANAELRYRRAKELLGKGAVSHQFFDDAEAALKAARAQVAAAEYALGAAQGRLRAARAASERAVSGFRKEDIDAARARVLQARGGLEEAQARLDEHEVHAPAAAVVEVLDLRPGDLVAPNAITARLLEADQLYVMVYVPETQIGRVRLGQDADVRVDAWPDEVFSGRVEQIRQQAEFLPRNVQTREERVHQVIGVKVRVDNRDDRLRAGVSAEVRFGRGSDK
jgi:ABC exporter DevB family membrane fusion protein